MISFYICIFLWIDFCSNWHHGYSTHKNFLFIWVGFYLLRDKWTHSWSIWGIFWNNFWNGLVQLPIGNSANTTNDSILLIWRDFWWIIIQLFAYLICTRVYKGNPLCGGKYCELLFYHFFNVHMAGLWQIMWIHIICGKFKNWWLNECTYS